MKWTFFVGGWLVLALAMTAQPQVAMEIGVTRPVDVNMGSQLRDSIPCIIITNLTMKAAFEQYAVFKTKQGSNTTVLTTEFIVATYPGDSSQIKIRNCIRDYHETKHTLWVILGGDIDVIKPMYPRCMLTDVMSDLYYSNLDHNWNENGDTIFGGQIGFGDTVDYYPDVYVGRIPCRTSAEASAVVSKLIAYQSDTTVVGYQTQALFNGTEVFGYGLEETRPNLETVRDLTPVSFAKQFYYQGPAEPVKAAMNAGMGFFVNISQSQNPTNFETQYRHGYAIITIDKNFIQSMSNTGKYGIWLNYTCNNNDLADTSAIARAYMLNPTGGGVSYLGSTGYHFPFEHANYERQVLDNLFYQGMPEVGKAVAEAKLVLVPTSPWSDYVDRYEMFASMYLGDPQMRIWTTSPRTLSLDCVPSLVVGGRTFTVRIVDQGVAVPGAVVCVQQDSTVYEVRIANSEGVAYFDSVNFPAPGLATVTATKQDYFPKELSIEIRTACCQNLTGNVDGDEFDVVDIADHVAMIDFLFFGGSLSDCPEENDTDRSGTVDIGDLAGC